MVTQCLTPPVESEREAYVRPRRHVNEGRENDGRRGARAARRTEARDLAATLLVGLAFLAAFALAKVAAVSALADVASGWRAPLLLAAVWVAVGLLLALALGVRASRLLGVNGIGIRVATAVLQRPS